ncbi:MAG: hypothetical protein U5K73_08620 [Halofilum sp. (in: g-proteobacteria)]|nr:hypothetical protein [Halofilum sp. (in: g-proteobacteria)]
MNTAKQLKTSGGNSGFSGGAREQKGIHANQFSFVPGLPNPDIDFALHGDVANGDANVLETLQSLRYSA